MPGHQRTAKEMTWRAVSGCHTCGLVGSRGSTRGLCSAATDLGTSPGVSCTALAACCGAW